MSAFDPKRTSGALGLILDAGQFFQTCASLHFPEATIAAPNRRLGCSLLQ
jgi:hypothetical protein